MVKFVKIIDGGLDGLLDGDSCTIEPPIIDGPLKSFIEIKWKSMKI